MSDIDPQACTQLLRAVTDQVAQSIVRPAPDATLPDLMRTVETLNAAAETRMRQALLDLYPDIGWSDADEMDGDTQTRPSDDRPYWVFDPVDAVYHALQGLPLWSSSLALVRGRRTVFGAVYDPVLREMFVASEGLGATLNGQPLRPVAKTRLDTAIVATFLAPPFARGKPERHDLTLRLISAVSKEVFVVRQMASASLHLAYVAAGRLDAVFDVTSTVHDWLAGGLLVTEAGLAMTDLQGERFDWGDGGIVAGPAHIVAALVEIVRGTDR